MTRLAPIAPDRMDAAQRRAYDAAVSGRRQHAPAPLLAWLHSPDMALHAQRLGECIRFDLHLPPRLIALAALTVATWWKAGYVQAVQDAKARAEGVPDAVVEAIKAGQAPALAEAADIAVCAAVRTLIEDRGLDAAAYARAVAVLGEQGLVELVAAVGYYTFVSMTVTAFGITTEAAAP